MRHTLKKVLECMGDKKMDRNFMLAIKGSQEIMEKCGVETWNKYHYLLNTQLCTIYNPDRFRERVRELYFEVRDDLPNIHSIASIIDEENEHILEEFYKSFSYSEIDVDNIICLYNNHVSLIMDVWVEEVLHSLSYPYSGSAFGNKKSYIDESQNILFKEFL